MFAYYIRKVFLYVSTDARNLAVRYLTEFVTYQMCVVFTKIVKEDQNLKTDLLLKVALAISGLIKNPVMWPWSLILFPFRSLSSNAFRHK